MNYKRTANQSLASDIRALGADLEDLIRFRPELREIKALFGDIKLGAKEFSDILQKSVPLYKEVATGAKELKNITVSLFKSFKEDVKAGNKQLLLQSTLYRDISRKVANLNKEFGRLSIGSRVFRASIEAGESFNRVLINIAKNLLPLIPLAFKVYDAFSNFDTLKNTLQVIIPGLAGINQALTGMKSGFEIVNDFLPDFKTRFNLIKEAALLNGAALKELAKQAFIVGVELEKSLTRLNTILKLNSDGLKKLTKDVADLSRETGSQIGSIKILNSQYDIASAGFNKASEALEVLRQSIRLSIVGYANLEQVTNLTAKALRAYSLSASDAGKVTAEINAIVESGITTVSELSTELGEVFTTGASIGISREEIGAAVSALTQVGQSTAEATTSINQLLLSIAALPPQAKEAVASLRLDGKQLEFDLASVKAEGLGKSLQNLIRASNGNVDTIRKVIPQVTALRAVFGITANSGNNFAAALESIKKASESDVTQLLNKRLQDTSARIQAIDTQLNELILSFGQKDPVKGVFLEGLASVEKLIRLINKDSDITKILEPVLATTFQITNAFERLTQIVQSLFNMFTGLATIFLPTKLFGLAFKGLTKGFDAVGDEFLALRALFEEGDFAQLTLRIFGLDQFTTLQNLSKSTRDKLEERLGKGFSIQIVNLAKDLEALAEQQKVTREAAIELAKSLNINPTEANIDSLFEAYEKSKKTIQEVGKEIDELNKKIDEANKQKFKAAIEQDPDREAQIDAEIAQLQEQIELARKRANSDLETNAIYQAYNEALEKRIELNKQLQELEARLQGATESEAAKIQNQIDATYELIDATQAGIESFQIFSAELDSLVKESAIVRGKAIGIAKRAVDIDANTGRDTFRKDKEVEALAISVAKSAESLGTGLNKKSLEGDNLESFKERVEQLGDIEQSATDASREITNLVASFIGLGNVNPVVAGAIEETTESIIRNQLQTSTAKKAVDSLQGTWANFLEVLFTPVVNIPGLNPKKVNTATAAVVAQNAAVSANTTVLGINKAALAKLGIVSSAVWKSSIAAVKTLGKTLLGVLLASLKAIIKLLLSPAGFLVVIGLAVAGIVKLTQAIINQNKEIQQINNSYARLNELTDNLIKKQYEQIRISELSNKKRKEGLSIGEEELKILAERTRLSELEDRKRGTTEESKGRSVRGKTSRGTTEFKKDFIKGEGGGIFNPLELQAAGILTGGIESVKRQAFLGNLTPDLIEQARSNIKDEAITKLRARFKDNLQSTSPAIRNQAKRDLDNAIKETILAVDESFRDIPTSLTKPGKEEAKRLQEFLKSDKKELERFESELKSGRIPIFNRIGSVFFEENKLLEDKINKSFDPVDIEKAIQINTDALLNPLKTRNEQLKAELDKISDPKRKAEIEGAIQIIEEEISNREKRIEKLKTVAPRIATAGANRKLFKDKTVGEIRALQTSQDFRNSVILLKDTISKIDTVDPEVLSSRLETLRSNTTNLIELAANAVPENIKLLEEILNSAEVQSLSLTQINGIYQNLYQLYEASLNTLKSETESINTIVNSFSSLMGPVGASLGNSLEIELAKQRLTLQEDLVKLTQKFGTETEKISAIQARNAALAEVESKILSRRLEQERLLNENLKARNEIVFNRIQQQLDSESQLASTTGFGRSTEEIELEKQTLQLANAIATAEQNINSVLSEQLIQREALSKTNGIFEKQIQEANKEYLSLSKSLKEVQNKLASTTNQEEIKALETKELELRSRLQATQNKVASAQNRVIESGIELAKRQNVELAKVAAENERNIAAASTAVAIAQNNVVVTNLQRQLEFQQKINKALEANNSLSDSVFQDSIQLAKALSGITTKRLQEELRNSIQILREQAETQIKVGLDPDLVKNQLNIKILEETISKGIDINSESIARIDKVMGRFSQTIEKNLSNVLASTQSRGNLFSALRDSFLEGSEESERFRRAALAKELEAIQQKLKLDITRLNLEQQTIALKGEELKIQNRILSAQLEALAAQEKAKSENLLLSDIERKSALDRSVSLRERASDVLLQEQAISESIKQNQTLIAEQIQNLRQDANAEALLKGRELALSGLIDADLFNQSVKLLAQQNRPTNQELNLNQQLIETLNSIQKDSFSVKPPDFNQNLTRQTEAIVAASLSQRPSSQITFGDVNIKIETTNPNLDTNQLAKAIQSGFNSELNNFLKQVNLRSK